MTVTVMLKGVKSTGHELQRRAVDNFRGALAGSGRLVGMTALRPGMTVREVVPGVPTRVLSLADQLRSIAAGFDQTARVFTPGQGAWFGPAFDAFAVAIGAYPPVYRQVAASFGAASVACRAHALELELAQAQARVALSRVDDAHALTARWQALPEPRPGPDPGAELLRVLTARVLAAQERVELSARLAAARLREASRTRIPEPPLALRMIARAVDAQRQFTFGALEATYDVGRMAAAFSPARIVADPHGYTAAVVGLGAGLKHGVNRPGELLTAMLDLDTWRTNPARALGHLAPDTALTIATGGAGAGTRAATATQNGVQTLVKKINPTPTAQLTSRLATSESPFARALADLLAHPERGSIGVSRPRAAGSGLGLPAVNAAGRISGSLWSATRTRTSVVNALLHFLDHRAEFPHLKNSLEYVAEAQDFLRSPPSTALDPVVRTNGDTVIYDPVGNNFGVMDRTGAPKTYFKPNPDDHGYATNLEYFHAQSW